MLEKEHHSPIMAQAERLQLKYECWASTLLSDRNVSGDLLNVDLVVGEVTNWDDIIKVYICRLDFRVSNWRSNVISFRSRLRQYAAAMIDNFHEWTSHWLWTCLYENKASSLLIRRRFMHYWVAEISHATKTNISYHQKYHFQVILILTLVQSFRYMEYKNIFSKFVYVFNTSWWPNVC